MGCADAVFSLKIMLKSRREHGIDSFAAFSDLVKAHDIVRHDVTLAALVNMGAPPKHVEWVEKLHGDFNVVLKLAKEEINMHGCVVRQGDNIAPKVLQLVAEDVLRTFIENRIEMQEAMCNEGPKGVLKLRKSRDLHDMIA